jgi:hypothetical protein
MTPSGDEKKKDRNLKRFVWFLIWLPIALWIVFGGVEPVSLGRVLVALALFPLGLVGVWFEDD